MWRHIVKTHVRTLIVIKLNRLCHGSFYFFYGMKLDIFKEFVLYCAVQSHLKQVELWSRKQIKKQVCQKKDDTPAF